MFKEWINHKHKGLESIERERKLNGVQVRLNDRKK